jgi:hypothetical protein
MALLDRIILQSRFDRVATRCNSEKEAVIEVRIKLAMAYFHTDCAEPLPRGHFKSLQENVKIIDTILCISGYVWIIE